MACGVRYGFRRICEYILRVKRSKLATETITTKPSHASDKERPWMECFGKLRSLRKETARIGKTMDREFGQIELAKGADRRPARV